MTYDPVTLDIIWNRLISICDEAETGLMRTAFSPMVRESKDFCCLLFDTNGDSIAQGSLSVVSYLCSAPLTTKNFLKKFPRETLEPGDILLTNLSWLSTGHLNDVSILEPIFHNGKLVALAGGAAHWPDIGGRGFMVDNRSVYEEGLQLPILKIAKRGQFNEEVMEIIRQNVRSVDDVMGDFRSQLVGNELMRRKLIELIESQGIDDFGAVAESILSRSEAAMRNAIAPIPDGDYENEIQLDGVDRPLTLKVRVSIRDTEIHIDYAGSSAQTDWAINSMPNYSYAYSFVAVKAAVGPYLPNNSGAMRAVSVSMPLGSIVNPRPPCAAASRHVVGHYCCPVVLGALAKASPHQVEAESAVMVAATMDGVGLSASVNYGGPGGLGARHNGDGISAMSWPANNKNTPIEMTECHTPTTLFERKQIRADSGGPGRYRGGCGEEIDVRLLDLAYARCQPMVERMGSPAQGLQGGHPGGIASLQVNGTPINSKQPVVMSSGDRLSVKTPGGGGFGDPLERDPTLVLEDVLDELVSLEQAEASYGVVIDAVREAIDREATAALRRSRRQQEASSSVTRSS